MDEKLTALEVESDISSLVLKPSACQQHIQYFPSQSLYPFSVLCTNAFIEISPLKEDFHPCNPIPCPPQYEGKAIERDSEAYGKDGIGAGEA